MAAQNRTRSRRGVFKVYKLPHRVACRRVRIRYCVDGPEAEDRNRGGFRWANML